MDKDKIEFLELKKRSKILVKEQDDIPDRKNAPCTKNATNPIMNAFLDFTRSKKFNVKDL